MLNAILDTFNLKEDYTIPVTKKPPLQIGVSKKMSHKLPEFQAELDYHDSSARSSPSNCGCLFVRL